MVGPIFMIGSLANALEEKFAPLIPSVIPLICAAVMQNDDEVCQRIGCGTISDIAYNAGKYIGISMPDLINCIDFVLNSKETTNENKKNALEAYGNLCLNTDDDFYPYIEKAMSTLNGAS